MIDLLIRCVKTHSCANVIMQRMHHVRVSANECCFVVVVNAWLDVGYDLWQDIVTATAALEEVKQSTKFAKILELILLIGNYMNAGSRNEQTLAFEFGFITKVWGQVFNVINSSLCQNGIYQTTVCRKCYIWPVSSYI